METQRKKRERKKEKGVKYHFTPMKCSVIFLKLQNKVLQTILSMMYPNEFLHFNIVDILYGPRHEKTHLRGLCPLVTRTDSNQTAQSQNQRLEILNLGIRGIITIFVGKAKVAICPCFHKNAKIRPSHDAAHIYTVKSLENREPKI